MKEFIAVATVHWYCDSDDSNNVDHIILTEVESYVDAVSRIENYYGNDLESVDVTLLEGPFVTMSGRYLDMFVTGQLEDEE